MKQLVYATLLASITYGCSEKVERNFAIVVDTQTYENARAEIDAYAQSVETYNGMTCHIVEDVWQHPDSIRQQLRDLYQEEKIEGVALIGDIPVVMFRDAQHFTSAFKMDQRADRRDSSIPSDRFYSDFDLKLNFIDKDEAYPYFYYSLDATSIQHVDSELYSGRIRPMTEEGKVDYAKLKAYLNKVVKAKQEENQLDYAFYFSGHGYISESVLARIDEQEAHYDHFPWLRGQRDRLGYVDHKQDATVKYRFMNEMMRPELDYAIVHHHGSDDTQYFNGYPEVLNPYQAKDYITRYGRSHLQRAVARGRDIKPMIQNLKKNMDVPYSWISDFNDPDVLAKDSVFNADLDLTIADFDTHGYMPNVRVLNIDACFCGSFHLNNSISNEYIFSEGNTVAVIANSVNVLQDKWSDKFSGLLGMGLPVGQITRLIPYLEAHTIGDPTFTFTPSDATYQVGDLLADPHTDWEDFLDNPYADLQNLAMVKLCRSGQLNSATLLDIYKQSASGIVRAQALELLSTFRDEAFITAVSMAVHDSFEMNQRFALKWIFKSGDPRLVDSLMEICVMNNTSERTNFNAVYALSVYPESMLEESFEKVFHQDHVRYLDKAETAAKIKKALHSSSTRWDDEIDAIMKAETSDKALMFNIRILRNNGLHYRFDELLDYLPQLRSATYQVALVEALGWHPYSFKRDDVRAKLLSVSQDESYAEEVRKEALKSYNRLD